MNRRLKIFGKIGLAVGKVMVPQIAQVEAAVKELKAGDDKRKAVIGTVTSSLALAEALSGEEIADVEQFQRGLTMINDGYVLLMNSLAKR